MLCLYVILFRQRNNAEHSSRSTVFFICSGNIVREYIYSCFAVFVHGGYNIIWCVGTIQYPYVSCVYKVSSYRIETQLECSLAARVIINHNVINCSTIERYNCFEVWLMDLWYWTLRSTRCGGSDWHPPANGPVLYLPIPNPTLTTAVYNNIIYEPVQNKYVEGRRLVWDGWIW